MSDRSSKRGMLYNPRKHRDFMYSALEAAVREGVGARTDVDDDSDCEQMGANNGPVATRVKRRYPSPILWYEEMTPADLDAYHAAHDPAAPTTGLSPRREASLSKHGRGRSDGYPSGTSTRSKRTDMVETTTSGCLVARFSSAVQSAATSETPPATAAAAVAAVAVMRRRGGPPEEPPPPEVLCSGSTSSVDAARDCAGLLGSSTGLTDTSQHDPSHCSRQGDGGYGNHDNKEAKYVAAPATAAAAPPDPSQAAATQTMFLPGLPSQVLMTQGCESWWDQEAEEATPASEYPFSLPPPLAAPSSGGASSLPRDGLEPAERQQATRVAVDGRLGGSSEPGMENTVYPPGEAGDRARDARARQYEDFTFALDNLVARQEASDGGTEATRGRDEGVKRTGGPSEKSRRPALSLVPTEEFLQQGWAGGPAGVVTTLESHLLRARQCSPDGYVARALELACHVLRQPRLCVSAGEGQGDVMRVPQRFGSSEVINRADHRGEVVGVAGLVWEMLRRAEGGSEGLKPGSADLPPG